MKNKNLLYSISLTSINRVISSILGFFRDMLFASLFGSTRNYDAFIIASHIPSFITYLISEAALTQTFIPLLAEKQITSTSENIKKFISAIMGTLLIFLLFLIAFSILFAPVIISLFAPGFSNETHHLAVVLFQILTISILFSTLSSYQSSVLNAYESYGLPSFMPIVFNLCMIGSAIFLSSFFKISMYALALGILLSSILQVIFLSRGLFKKNLFLIPSFQFKTWHFRKPIKIIFPALIGVSVMQAGVMIDLMFASYLPQGSITWLYYSTRLMELPVTLFAIGITTVTLPHLGRSHASNNNVHFQSLFDWTLRLALITSVPACLGLFFLANPIIITLFNHGQFTQLDALMTAKSTQAFSIGVFGFTLTKICATGFYAKQNVSLPAKIASICVGLNVFFNMLLISRYQHAGLALATSLSSLLNATILFFVLVKKKYYQVNKQFYHFLLKIMIASLLMVSFIVIFTPPVTHWIFSSIAWRIEHLLIMITLSMFVYLIVLRMLGIQYQTMISAKSFTFDSVTLCSNKQPI